MTKWMKYGSIVICLLAILLFLIGVSQLTFGAYYISKLPVFKVGSPVWIGFMNIACAVILFWFHHKSLELRPLLRRFRDAAQPKKNVQTVETAAVLCGRTHQYRLHWSLGLCLTIAFINIANIIICEVGEWQHWLTRGEREQVTTGNLSLLGIQAHRVTVAQMSLATIVGVLSTVLNVWLLYKQPSSGDTMETDSDAGQISLNQTLTSVNTGTLLRPAKSKASSNSGFDNPNWVYSEEKDSMRSQHAQQTRPSTSVSVISDGMRTDGGNGVAVRYATIRRAPSILNVLPAADQHSKRHLKSASFRMEGERSALYRPHRAPSAAVSRSKTMRETSFSSAAVHYPRFNEVPHTFAQRFQSSTDGALSFVHDVTAEEEEAAAAAAESSVISIDPPVPSRVSNGAQTSAILEETSDDEESPAALPVVRRQVRSSDRIILRVESFRQTVQSCTGIPVRTPTAPVQRPALMVRNANVKRVSSSTQTELSVLKPASASLVAAQQQRMQKRPQTNYPTLVKNGSSTPAQTTNNHSLVSPVESSSGYSSPRGTESKSPTPEPKQQLDRDASDASNQDPANVTVIQIDPNPVKTARKESSSPQYILAPVTEATYAIPRKRSERNATTPSGLARNDVPPHRDADFQVSINAKAVQRSASFQHMSQAGKKDYYSNEWLRAGTLLENQPVMTIPRPMLKGSQQRYTSTMSRRHVTSEGRSRSSSSGSSLNRSTSMYLAMSEIQRKLDLLQWLGPRAEAVRNAEMAPVHRDSYSSTDDQYYSHGSAYSRYSEAPKRNRSRTGSRQMTALPPAPPPPPPAAGAANPLELDETIDSAKTLAYLSELEMLARHWRAQLLYKVELNAPEAQIGSMVENDSFQC